jgi:hypothetical protein
MIKKLLNLFKTNKEQWVSIHDAPPYCTAQDYLNLGYTMYTVKDIHGNIFDSPVFDDTWVEKVALPQNITHYLKQ